MLARTLVLSTVAAACALGCGSPGLPVANAGGDRTVPLHARVSLDGTASFSRAGDTLRYQWAVLRSPAGASVVLSDEASAQPSFVTNGEGDYVFALAVFSDHGFSQIDTATLHAANTSPVAKVGPDQRVERGTAITLSSAGTSDADADPLQFQWTLVAPAGSTAVLSDPASPSPGFVADQEGLYTATLIVSDGIVSSAPASMTVRCDRHLQRIDLELEDAEYSAALDRIVLAAQYPNRLYLVDPVTETLTWLDLGFPPLKVSVSPDGLHAAVTGTTGALAYLTLSPLALVRTVAVGPPGDPALGSAYAYLIPQGSGPLYTVRLSDGTVTQSTNTLAVYGGTRARLHPAGTKVYGADNNLSPSDIYRYDVDSRGTLQRTRDSPYHGDYPMCGDLWFTTDGARILTRCGRLFYATDVTTTDMTYAGALDNGDGTVPYVVSASHSAARGEFAVVLGNAYPETGHQTLLQVHDATTLALRRRYTLPEVVLNGQATPTHGQFVFHSADGSKIFAVVQLDQTVYPFTAHGIVIY